MWCTIVAIENVMVNMAFLGGKIKQFSASPLPPVVWVWLVACCEPRAFSVNCGPCTIDLESVALALLVVAAQCPASCSASW